MYRALKSLWKKDVNETLYVFALTKLVENTSVIIVWSQEENKSDVIDNMYNDVN